MQTLVIGSAANLYQVKPGDTLDGIARRYGLSRSELIQANGLNNPNLLSVNQQLSIPKTQPGDTRQESVTLLPGISSKPNTVPSGQQRQGVTMPTLAIPAQPGRVTPVVSTAPLSKPLSVPRSVLAQSTVASSTTSSTVVVGTQPSQSNDSQNNPYIEKLRADILKLREDSRHQNESGQASTPKNVTVPTVTAPVASSLNNTSTASRINPEFNPRRYNESLQAERDRRRQQQQVQQGSIQIEVPQPETNRLASSPGLVAVAPAPADGYNPSLQIPVGQTVSPELPSLSPPDIYLPGNPAQVNGYIWPTKGVLTSGYGRRWGRMHKGIDIAAPIGTPVVAAAPGVVVSAGWNSGGYGNLVEIQHPDGSLTLYAHNNRILVRRGQEVAQGQQISEMGSTGRSTGPHCHFEVHPAGRGAVNPIAYLPKTR
jgi:murein DD-endopeptidase MepM/ murein hydrolase activator NlpD